MFCQALSIRELAHKINPLGRGITGNISLASGLELQLLYSLPVPQGNALAFIRVPSPIHQPRTFDV